MSNKFTLLDFECTNPNCPVRMIEQLVSKTEGDIICPECHLPMKIAEFCVPTYGKHGSWAMWRRDQDW